MSSNYKHKNLLFYSNRDQASLAFLQELSKNPLLDKQFVKICVNDPRVKIPQRIIQYNKIPVVVCPGFDTPILGEDAFTWLQNNSFSEKSNGVLDFGNIKDSKDFSSEHSTLVEEFKRTDYNGYHNDEYNLGFNTDNKVVNSQFSNVQTQSQEDATRINTFEDNESKRGSKGVLDERMKTFQFHRDNDMGNPKRGGTLEHNEAYKNNQYRTDSSPQQQQQQQPPQVPDDSGVHGAQISAFGNMGTNLDQAYMPPPNANGGKHAGGGRQDRNEHAGPSIQYNPNGQHTLSMPQQPMMPPNMMAPMAQPPNVPMMPNMPRGFTNQPFTMPSMPVNAPHSAERGVRGSANPYTGQQPMPPPNGLTVSPHGPNPRSMSRPPATMLMEANGGKQGPMMPMTPPSRGGIPLPSGGGGSNYYPF